MDDNKGSRDKSSAKEQPPKKGNSDIDVDSSAEKVPLSKKPLKKAAQEKNNEDQPAKTHKQKMANEKRKTEEKDKGYK